jgi:CBS domain-containing protein
MSTVETIFEVETSPYRRMVAMKARDVMTTDVISVKPDAPARQVARLLLEKGISAVPVVSVDGVPMGMVSEGDLIGRPDDEREARTDWWLTLIANREKPDPDLVKRVLTPGAQARDLMVGPVVTISEDTDVREIARILGVYRVKRVPVVRDGRVVGIVSRADLLRAMAAESAPVAQERQREGLLSGALSSLDEHFLHRRAPQKSNSAPPRGSGALAASASEFYHLATTFEEEEATQRANARAAALAQRKHAVSALAGEHVSDEVWRSLVNSAREAATHGKRDFMLLRFPSQLCSDGGRAINVAETEWPATLRGEAAELYLRWEHELKPRGFHLSARVLDFPGGKLGDIGLFIGWAV